MLDTLSHEDPERALAWRGVDFKYGVGHRLASFGIESRVSAGGEKSAKGGTYGED
jgi:hypothetical protein